ncbi:MAG: hypothetical protein L6R40_002871 [Gallowayella cf. fulva]|nr:MAG: hypothetical protein L6R40_002871 [Xanthomendoza cf. fulva]
MASAASVVRRALLYVPSSSRKMLEKSQGLTVDCVAYDLEDSVSPNMKAEARQNLRSHLSKPRPAGITEQAVRINDVRSGLAEDDLAAVCQTPNLDTVVIPKVDAASDIRFVTDYLTHHRGNGQQPPKILALIESAKSLSNLSSICTASPFLSGLIFAAEDFAFDLSLTRTSSLTEFLYARSAIVTAARAHELPSTIDLVCTSFKGEEGERTLEEECIGGKTLGFNGKQCIHPNQVGIAQRAFAPGEKEVEWAVRVTIADGKVVCGAWSLDGKMVDVPVVRKAKVIVERAEVCGIDIAAVREKWKDQEPE